MFDSRWGSCSNFDWELQQMLNFKSFQVFNKTAAIRVYGCCGKPVHLNWTNTTYIWLSPDAICDDIG